MCQPNIESATALFFYFRYTFYIDAKFKIFAHIAFAPTFILRSFCFKLGDMEQLADGT